MVNGKEIKGTILKEFRKKLGLSGVMLAKKIHLNQGTISKYESGKIKPDEQIIENYRACNPELFDVLVNNQSFSQKFRKILARLCCPKKTKIPLKTEHNFTFDQLYAFSESTQWKSFSYDERFRVEENASFDAVRIFKEIPELLGLSKNEVLDMARISSSEYEDIVAQKRECTQVSLRFYNQKLKGFPAICIANPEVDLKTLYLAFELLHLRMDFGTKEILNIVIGG